MNNGVLENRTIYRAGDICARFDLDDRARPLLRPGASPREFVEALVTQNLCGVGIDFLAHALPAREGIWWGCLCAQHVFGSNWSPEDRAVCAAVVQWVIRPTEANRAATKTLGEDAPPPSPSGSLATAVSLTGGSLGPPNLPVIPPPPFAWARHVAAAVKFAAIRAEPAKIGKTKRAFVELGLNVAEGLHS